MISSRLILFATLLAASGLHAAGGVRFPTYAEVRPVLDAFAGELPPQLKPFPGLALKQPWAQWVEARDGEIRARLAQGDQDTIVNWMMYGTTFTAQPRALTPAGATLDAAAVQRLLAITSTRIDDLIRALTAPGSDERRLFARTFFEQNGFTVRTATGRRELRNHLIQALDRVAAEQEQLAQQFAVAQQSGDPLQQLALSQRMYWSRGLSLDTSLAPNFGIEQALAALKAKDIARPGSIRRVGIIGAGLDFADKNAGFDGYPVQTVQPFAVIDTLRRLDLAPADGVIDVVALDISPRVLDHVRRLSAQAARGRDYTMTLPLARDDSWTPAFLDYWNVVGSRAGASVAAPVNAALSALADVRTIRVPAATARRVTAADVDIVTQRLDGAAFDLIVGTNIFVYYDALDQSLALANAVAMLKTGGLLLSNTVLPEVAALPVDVANITTTNYTRERKDVVLSYRVRAR